jgi:hypothetical protein
MLVDSQIHISPSTLLEQTCLTIFDIDQSHFFVSLQGFQFVH